MNIRWMPAVLSLIVANSATGHEFWLDPIDASIKKGSSIIVDIRNGQNYAGASFPYYDKSFISVTFSSGGESVPYKGRIGDYPALHKELDQEGLHAITVNSNYSLLEYKSWEQFSNFLNYHGLDSIRSQHKTRQLPRVGVTEEYRRNAKTLVQVTPNGDPQVYSPSDSTAPSAQNNAAFIATSTEFEMILLNNPFEETKEIRLQLLYEGKPLADRQTELFWRGEPVRRLTSNTDTNGIAVFELSGDGDYMLNAVHVVAPPADDEAHWHSRWATITFERRGFGDSGKNNSN